VDPVASAESTKPAAAADSPIKLKKAWEKTESEYVSSRLLAEIRRYDRAVKEQEEIARSSKNPKTRAKAESTAKFWAATLEGMRSARDGSPDKVGAARIATFKEEYVEVVRKAISTGEQVPAEIIAQSDAFQKAKDARARYDKGRHTSFANRSVAVDETMQETRGYKVKRQDGKPITDDQKAQIDEGVREVEAAIGPLVDVMRQTDLTIAHTSGKFPFMKGDAGGLYHIDDRTVSIGVSSLFGEQRALAHELGHWLDYEAGRALNVKARIYTKSGKSHVSTSMSEAVKSEREAAGAAEERALIEKAGRLMHDPWEASKLVKKDAAKIEDEGSRNETKHLQFKLTPYWRESREIWARLVEQYVATKTGKRGRSQEGPNFYERYPAWWSKENFAQLMPEVEARIQQKLEAIRSAAPPKPAEGSTLFAKLDAIEAAAKDRIKKRQLPRGRGTGGETIISDSLDAAVIVAVKAARATVKGGKALANIVSEVLASEKAFAGINPARVQRLARTILKEAGPDNAKLGQAIRDVQKVARGQVAEKAKAAGAKEGKALGREEGKAAQVRAAEKVVRNPSDVMVPGVPESRRETPTLTEGQALRGAMSKAEKAARRAYDEGKRETVAVAKRKLAEVHERYRDKIKRVRSMDGIEARGKAEQAAAWEKARADIAAGTRAEVVRLVRDTLPQSIAGKYLEAVRDVKTPASLSRLIGRMRRDLAKHEWRMAQKDAKKAAGAGSRAKLLEQYKAEVTAAQREMVGLRADVEQAEAKLEQARKRRAALRGTTTIKSPARKRERKNSRQAQEGLEAAMGAASEGMRQASNEIRSALFKQKADEKVRVGKKVMLRETVVNKLTGSIESRGKEMRGGKGPLSETRRAGMFRRFKDVNLNADTLSVLFGGDDADIRRVMVEDFWDGENAANKLVQETHAELERLLRANGYEPGADNTQRLSRDVSKDEADVLTLDLPKSGKVSATPAEWMKVYAYLTDSKFRPEIQGGRELTWARAKRWDELRFSAADVAAVLDQVPKPLRNVVDGMKAWRETAIKPGLMKAFREQTGYDLDVRDGYEPGHVNREKPPEESLVGASFTNVKRALESLGFLQATVDNARAPLVVTDFFADYMEHAHHAAVASHMTRPVRTFEMIFKDKRTRKQVERFYGEEMVRRLDRHGEAAKLIFNEQLQLGGRIARWINKNIGKSVLTLNPGTMLKQIGGIFKLHAVMDAKDMAAGMKLYASKEVSDIIEDDAFFKDRYEEAAWRRMTPGSGERTPLLGEAKFGQAFSRMVLGARPGWRTLKPQVRTRFAAMHNLIDRITLLDWFDKRVSRMAVAASLAKAERLGLQGAQRKAFAAKEAGYAIRRTQNSHSPLDMSELAEGWRRTGMSSLLMFSSDSNKTYNLLVQGMAQGGGKARRAYFAAGMNAAWSAFVTALMAGLDELWRGDKPEKAKGRIIDRALSDLGRGLLPVYGGSALVDGAGVIIRRLFGGTQPWRQDDAFTFPLLQAVNDAAQLPASAYNALTAEGRMRTGPHRGEDRQSVMLRRFAFKAANDLGRLLGVPTAPLVKWARYAIE